MFVLAEFTSFNGLPAHPLLVHIPVILIPLALIGAIVALVRPAWRSWAIPTTAVIAGGGLFGLQIAMMSGEGMLELTAERKAVLDQHRQLAEQARPITFLFFCCIAGAAVAAYLAQKGSADAARTATLRKAVVPLLALSVITGALSTAWVYRTGHTGAESVWKGEGRLKGDKRGDTGDRGGSGATPGTGLTPQSPTKPAPDGDTDGN
jgi:uncharacterized membrane protein